MRLYQCSLVVGLVSAMAACGGSVSTDHTGATGGPTPGDDIDSGTTPPPPTDTGTPPPADAGPTPDTATPPPADHGAPSDKYPAFKPEVPELQNNGGDVLTSPIIVTVTFPGETNADTYEAFGDKIGASSYWKEITSEYGIGAAVSGPTNHVRMTEKLPAGIADDSIDTWLADRLADPAKYGLPAPTKQSIYVLYIDQATDFQYQGSSVCGSGIGGYHTSTAVGGQQVAYAILPQCPGGSGGGISLVDETTLSSSHEIAEATLDPHPMDTPGIAGVDDDHLAWEFFMQFQSENGDMCEVYRDSYYRPKTDGDFTSMVQRQWSNKSGADGHNPCVPAPTGAYFNTTPLALEDITLDLSKFGAGSHFKSKGFKILVGETKTFQVGFYSDASTAPWTIKASEANAFSGGTTKTHNLDVTIDKTSGQNGEKANVTVKVLTAGKTKGELLTIVSTQGSTQHTMPILIGSQ